MSLLHQFLFGIYPYIAIVFFLFGSLVRFEKAQYTWGSESSQLIEPRFLRLGSNLFHIGIILLFVGHLFGLLTPVAVWDFLGISHAQKQMVAMMAGGIFGLCALVGLLLLLYRRLDSARLRAQTTWRDKLVLLWILVTLLLGLSTIWVSSQHRDGSEMLALMHWAQHIVTFRGDAASFIVNVSWVFKVHLLLGITLFLIFPFSRLVHVWSGVGSVAYLTRVRQIVRSR